MSDGESKSAPRSVPKTTYLAAYDTEAEACLPGVRKIVERLLAHRMPATFFIVAELLDRQGAEYRELLDGHPDFEIASHSYTHMLLRDHPVCGRAGPAGQFRREIVDSKKRIEDFFGREVAGFRPPVGFEDGLRGAPELLALCREAGYRYISSLAWGPHTSLPALILDPFTYKDAGYPELWELPLCGWHENLLKGNNRCGALRLGLFPSAMPEAQLTKYIETPEEECAINRLFIDQAAKKNAPHVTLIWHPWSLHRFDPEMTMLEATFRHVRQRRLPCATFASFLEELPARAQSASRRRVSGALASQP